MKAPKLVEHLLDAVVKLGYRVRVEQGRFRGGSCVHSEEKLVFINRRMGDEERAEVLGRVLAAHDLDQIYLRPEVREFIEKFSLDSLASNTKSSETTSDNPSSNDQA